MRRLIYMHAQRHIETFQRRSLDHHLRGITEIRELHQFIQLIIGDQLRLFQYIGHIRRTQHTEAAKHIQPGDRPAHHTREIDKSLAISLRVTALLGIDDLEVLRPHTNIHGHVVEIGEIQLARDNQWAAIIGIHLKVLE